MKVFEQTYGRILFHLLIIIVVELKKLEVEGFGVYVDKTTMEVDKLFPAKNSFAAFVKKDILDMQENFLTMQHQVNVLKRCMF